MTKYTTCGKEEWTDYHIPLVYREDIFLAEFSSHLCQLIFLENGELILKDQESTGHYSAPLILLINSKNRITEMKCRSTLCYNFIFTPDALNSNYNFETDWTLDSMFFFLKPFIDLPANGYSCRSFPHEYNLRLSQLCRKMLLHLKQQTVPQFWPCLSRSYFMEILILIERFYYLSQEYKELSIPETGTKIDEIFIYLHTHYSEKITLDQLCRCFATNRTTLNRLFQDIYNTSVMAYLNSIRLEIAVSLLKNTILPVNQVADRIGIDDLSYFGRIFKQKTGFTPSEFRKTIPSPYKAAY